MNLSVVVGFVIGAFIGSSFGIAGFGGAIAGTIPFGLLGAYIGYRFSQRRKGKTLSETSPD